MADIRNYAAVTSAYWGFTLTDGALRMLVLLHFHELGYQPLDLAFLFLLYEAMGVLTNFFGGWLGARYGLRLTLFAGLSTQIVALSMLALLPEGLTVGLSVAYVMASQALSGVAKDLTKMSSKSAVKLVVDSQQNGVLFKWVAMLTGSKNALKGVGFFLGGILLQVFGFEVGLYLMAGALALVLLACLLFLKSDLGKAKEKIRGRELFSKTREINFLSAARIFLFASRDVWFVVGLPIFLAGNLGWSFNEVGAFMAAWVIGYGVMQAGVPGILRNLGSQVTAARGAMIWGMALCALPALIGVGVSDVGKVWIEGIWPNFPVAQFLVGGLIVFGLVFAVNSTLHSYLIVAYSDADKVALNVGFYYMANAVGRLVGTLMSGLVYQYFGLVACLAASSGLVMLAVMFTVPLSSLERNVLPHE